MLLQQHISLQGTALLRYAISDCLLTNAARTHHNPLPFHRELLDLLVNEFSLKANEDRLRLNNPLGVKDPNRDRSRATNATSRGVRDVAMGDTTQKIYREVLSIVHHHLPIPT